MKTLLTLLLISLCSFAFGQVAKSPYKQVADQNKKEEPTIPFDALNGAIIQESINADRYKQKADSAKWVIIDRMLTIKRIDRSLISNHPDSSRVTPEGIFLKLKPKKK